jgi:hypothetical protein
MRGKKQQEAEAPEPWVVPTTGVYARIKEIMAGRLDPPTIVVGDDWVRPTRVIALLRALPGFAALWEAKVPVEYLERAGEIWRVKSPCGELVLVELAVVTFCPDDCGRWFLRTERDVRVKRWDREPVAA